MLEIFSLLPSLIQRVSPTIVLGCINQKWSRFSGHVRDSAGVNKSHPKSSNGFGVAWVTCAWRCSSIIPTMTMNVWMADKLKILVVKANTKLRTTMITLSSAMAVIISLSKVSSQKGSFIGIYTSNSAGGWSWHWATITAGNELVNWLVVIEKHMWWQRI